MGGVAGCGCLRLGCFCTRSPLDASGQDVTRGVQTQDLTAGRGMMQREKADQDEVMFVSCDPDSAVVGSSVAPSLGSSPVKCCRGHKERPQVSQRYKEPVLASRSRHSTIRTLRDSLKWRMRSALSGPAGFWNEPLMYLRHLSASSRVRKSARCVGFSKSASVNGAGVLV